MASVMQVLNSIEPEDGKLTLGCSPEYASSVWYGEVSYRDQRAFNFHAEPYGVGQCRVWLEYREFPTVPSWKWLMFTALLFWVGVYVWMQ